VSPTFDLRLEALEPTGELGRQFGVDQDAEPGLEVTGGMGRRACSVSKSARLTGSPSKAILCAKFNGIHCQRRRCFSVSGRSRHC
jgi:hypothetical protein